MACDRKCYEIAMAFLSDAGISDYDTYAVAAQDVQDFMDEYVENLIELKKANSQFGVGS